VATNRVVIGNAILAAM